MTGALRYTALRLAALHKADRAWLLERLPVAEAAKLRALVATPGIQRLARVAGAVDAPAPSPVSPSTPAITPPQAHRAAARGTERLDPRWASLVHRATSPDEPALPARLAAALIRWVPGDEADA